MWILILAMSLAGCVVVQTAPPVGVRAWEGMMLIEQRSYRWYCELDREDLVCRVEALVDSTRKKEI